MVRHYKPKPKVEKPLVIENIGRVGTVVVETRTIERQTAENMMRDVDLTHEKEKAFKTVGPRVDDLRAATAAGGKRISNNFRVKGNKGKFSKKRGPAKRGLLPAGFKSRAKKYDFRKVCGLIPLSRPSLLMAAAFRDQLQAAVRQLHAGTEAGIYTWCVANSAVRHEMRALMLQEILAERIEELTIEQKCLVVKHICDASDDRDACLKEIELDRLSELAEAVDPWKVAPAPPDQLPPDVISPVPQYDAGAVSSEASAEDDRNGESEEYLYGAQVRSGRPVDGEPDEQVGADWEGG